MIPPPRWGGDHLSLNTRVFDGGMATGNSGLTEDLAEAPTEDLTEDLTEDPTEDLTEDPTEDLTEEGWWTATASGWESLSRLCCCRMVGKK